MNLETGYHEAYVRKLLEKHGREALLMPRDELKALVAGELAPFDPSKDDVSIIAFGLHLRVREAAPPQHRAVSNLHEELYGKEERQ